MSSLARDRAAQPLRTAVPPTVAVHTVRRRASLVRWGVWAAVAAGPLALAVAVLTPPARSAPVYPHAPASARPVPAADPGGAAALFLDLWLRSDASAPDGPAAQSARALGPQVPLPDHRGAAFCAPLATAAVRSLQLPDGSWSVVVAAEFAATDSSAVGGQPSTGGARVRYFAVPVTAGPGSGGAGAITVTSAPAEVAGPDPVKAAGPTLTTAVSQGPLATTLGQFFGSYLTGVGPVDPYLAPGVRVRAPGGGSFRTVAVESVMSDAQAAAGASVPGDGTRVQVQVQVTATDASGSTWPLTYMLQMAARAGRWEVAALDAGVPASSPAPTPSPAGAVGGAR